MLARREGKVALLVAVFALLTLQGAFAGETAGRLQKVIEGNLQRYFDQVPVEVIVKNPGQVTLKGVVANFEDERLAYDIASRVKGVRTITYDVVVRPAKMVQDSEIKDELTGYLSDNSQITDPENIHVAVNKGVVTLSGSVLNYKEFETADRVAAWQMGVTDVVNDLKILNQTEKHLTDSQLAEIVRGVIADRFPMARNMVTVNVADGNVALNGRVETLWEKDNLPREIHRVKGVKDVTSHLILTEPEESPTALR